MADEVVAEPTTDAPIDGEENTPGEGDAPPTEPSAEELAAAQNLATEVCLCIFVCRLMDWWAGRWVASLLTQITQSFHNQVCTLVEVLL